MSQVKGVHMGTVFHIPYEQAITPKDGDCITGAYWSFHPSKGLAFYAKLSGYAKSDTPSPQCNRQEETAKRLTARLYPDHEVLFIPVVFMGHAYKEFNRLKKSNSQGENNE